jgi:transposase InsO family protein
VRRRSSTLIRARSPPAGSGLKELEDAGVKISMDDKGRWIDNVFIERLWQTVKYEEVYRMIQQRTTFI